TTNYAPGTQPSEFAFVVGNTSALTANVVVHADSIPDITATVAPNTTQAIKLPWRGICGTGLAKFAYHLTSDVPITVYQFNPLASAVPSGASCNNDFQCGLDKCINHVCTTFSYSNDASLLLPTHLLGTSYVVVATDQVSEGNGIASDTPLAGMMAIVSTADN